MSSSFDIEEMDIKLDTEFIGSNFIIYDEVNSTNEQLLSDENIKNHGTVLLAENQFVGRGRLGRKWLSEKDMSLTFSILLNEDITPDKLNLINLGASLAVAKSLENLYQLDVHLKWPNDVLISNRKISGILVESTSKGKNIERAVIGIGINVNQPAFEGKFMMTPTSIRREFGKPVKRERLISEILNEFEEIITQINKKQEVVLDAWRSRCNWIGEKVKIENVEESIFGIFENIDSDGFLLLRQKDGTKKIINGDVSLRKM
ncbi:MAG: biotin--[acetyl-CoA-carboxylase] ligase [Bacteroidota bacterium]